MGKRGLVTPARVLVLGEIATLAQQHVLSVHVPDWVAVGNLVALRFCDILPSALGWTGTGNMAQAKALITTAIHTIDGLCDAAGYDWQTLRSSVRVEGDMMNGESLWSATAVLPQGPWIAQLLTGQLSISVDAYTVLAPHSTYIEVTLDAQTAAVLKDIGQLRFSYEGRSCAA